VDARQCKKCKRLFQYVGNPLCPSCIKEMDHKFNAVRDYLYDNANASMEEVCEKCEVEMPDIRRWLAEGRLMLAKGSPIMLQCEKCGAPILTGKQCEQCLAKLKNSLQGAADSMRPKEERKPLDYNKDSGKMHVGVGKKKT